VGNGCSRELIINASKYGNGSASFIKESNLNILREKVVESLQNASEPALIGCKFTFIKKPTLAANATDIDPTETHQLG